MSTTSIGITKWANGSEITEICRAGEGDNRVIAWRRPDGAVALETNGDPVFGDEAEAWIHGVQSAQHVFAFATDSQVGEIAANSIEDAYAQLRDRITPAMIADGATLWVEDESGNRITMGIDRD